VKGIILAGGTGSRLEPLTIAVSKQLLPLYDKPLIYYPLSTLMLAGIRDILIITTPHDQSQFQKLLKDGSQWGIKLTYEVQNEPRGIAEALILGQRHIDGDHVALILGDNVFFGPGLGRQLSSFAGREGATIFAFETPLSKAYGVAEIGVDGQILSIEEKPTEPKSNYAIPGLYFYDQSASSRARALVPSLRGELEITDLNKLYWADGFLQVVKLESDTQWFDAGTFESMHEAETWIRNFEKRTGQKVSSPEEVSWRMDYIDQAAFSLLASNFGPNHYGEYLRSLAKNLASQ